MCSRARPENGDFDTVLRDVPVVVDTIIRYLSYLYVHSRATRGLIGRG